MRINIARNNGLITILTILAVAGLAACGGGGGMAPDLIDDSNIWPEHRFVGAVTDSGFELAAVDASERFIDPLTAGLRLEVSVNGDEHRVAVYAADLAPVSDVYLHLGYPREVLHPADTSLAAGLDGEAVFLGLTSQPGVVVMGLSGIHSRELPVEGLLCEVIFRSGSFSSSSLVRKVNIVSDDPVDDLHFNPTAPDTLQWTYSCKGDYNQDSRVTVADLTPIGIYYDYNTTYPDWPKALPADGSEDGWITVGDLTPIGQHYNEAVTGYLVQSSSIETGPFSGGPEVLHETGVAPPQGGFLEFSFQVPSPTEDDWYVVRSKDNDELASAPSAAVQYHADYVFNPPRNLVAVPDVDSIRLNWAPPAGGAPDSYACYVSVVEMTQKSDGVKMHTELVTDTTFLVPAMFGNPDTDHYFGVIAIYGEEESELSNIYHYQPGGLYPPRSLAASVDGDHIQLDWEVPAAGVPTGYNAYIADNPTMTSAVPLNTGDITGLTFDVNILFSPDDSHYFGVKALYGVDESDYSNIYFYQPEGSLAPANLIAVRDDDHVRLKWSAPADTPPDSYHAYVADNGEMTSAVRLNGTPITDIFYAVSSAISPDEPHYFAVTANYGTTESEYSNIFYYDPDAETDPPTWPGGTGIEAATPGDERVTVEWFTATDTESPPVVYLIHYAETASFDWATAAVVSQPSTATQTAITGLTNGTEYTFGVRARDNVGNTDDNTNTLAATPFDAGTPVDSGIWGTSELVDNGGILPHQKTGWFTSIALAADGTIGIAHYNETGQDLLYTELADGSMVWTTETVTSSGETGLWPSIEFDPVTDEPCIAYHNASEAQLEYAVRSGGEWQVEVVHTGTDYGAYASLEFDPGDNNPAIAYLDYVGKDVQYAKWDGTEWDLDTAYNGSTSSQTTRLCEYISLAFNPDNGQPGITFMGPYVTGMMSYDACWITEFSGSSWNSEMVYAGPHTDIGFGTAGYANSLCYNPDGVPYIMTVELMGEIFVCEKSSGSWAQAAIGSVGTMTGTESNYVYTDMDWHENLFHFVYYNQSGALYYGAGFAGVAVESGNVGGFPSLEITADDEIHISYYDYNGHNLRYAVSSDGVAWDFTEAANLTDAEGSVGERASLEYHPTGYYPMISYYDASNTALKYADKQLGTWQKEIVRNERYDGSASEMGINAAGEVSIGFFAIDGTGGGLYVATGDYGNWDFDTVLEFDLTVGGDVAGNYCSLAVNYPPNEAPGLAYYNASTKQLEYQEGDGAGGFDPSTIDQFNDPGRWSSVAFNPANKFPGVAYHSRDNGNLNFAQLSGTTEWVSVGVDTAGIVGNRCSLAYDPSTARQWISYYDTTSRTLKVAYVKEGMQFNETSAWDFVSIPAPGGSTNYGAYSSIAWHPVHDRPAVAFYDSEAKKLWYVFIGDPDAPQAAVEVTGGTNKEGIFPSLVFNPDDGQPGIAYHDGTDGDLLYIKRGPTLP